VNCHGSNKWSEVEFDHSKTGYILEGAHLRQSCRSCHFKPGEQSKEVQQFSQLSSSCTGCHKDEHQKQFGEPVGTSCLKCHDYFDWTAGLFNHDQTAFPLDGKHKNVACNKCHPPVVTAQLSFTWYKLKRLRMRVLSLAMLLFVQTITGRAQHSPHGSDFDVIRKDCHPIEFLP